MTDILFKGPLNKANKTNILIRVYDYFLWHFLKIEASGCRIMRNTPLCECAIKIHNRPAHMQGWISLESIRATSINTHTQNLSENNIRVSISFVGPVMICVQTVAHQPCVQTICRRQKRP